MDGRWKYAINSACFALKINTVSRRSRSDKRLEFLLKKRKTASSLSDFLMDFRSFVKRPLKFTDIINLAFYSFYTDKNDILAYKNTKLNQWLNEYCKYILSLLTLVNWAFYYCLQICERICACGTLGYWSKKIVSQLLPTRTINFIYPLVLSPWPIGWWLSVDSLFQPLVVTIEESIIGHLKLS